MPMPKRESARFYALAKTLLRDPRFQKLRAFRAHGKTDLFEHSVRVAMTSHKLSRALRLRINEGALIRGALLHDYYLYDWHNAPKKAGLHGLTHAHRARKNAERDFHLNQRERNIIESHMWPLNPTCLPKSREAWLVCLADKLCSLLETLRL